MVVESPTIIREDGMKIIKLVGNTSNILSKQTIASEAVMQYIVHLMYLQWNLPCEDMHIQIHISNNKMYDESHISTPQINGTA